MNERQVREIGTRYPALRIAVVGDLCLDRYFEIDPGLQETSIETNLPVHNVVRVRCQPGASGTILNNLSALGTGQIIPVAILGTDGEGYELRKALQANPAVKLDYLVQSPDRRTFTYSKPLVMHKNRPPEELNRLDIKNWTPTPDGLQDRIIGSMLEIADKVDAFILLDQVDIAETGVITRRVLQAVREITSSHPNLLILADSRRSLRDWPPVALKMNAAELALYFGANSKLDLSEVKEKALSLSAGHGKPVFVTLSEHGMVGAFQGAAEWVPSLPTRGPIDIVGAGDSVTANLTAALASGASLREALEMAQLAASIVVHQLGTTGTASPEQIADLLRQSPFFEQ